MVIPNGLSITANGETYNFASLNARDATYELIIDMWKATNPEAYAAFITTEGDAPNEEEAEKDLDRGNRKTHAATQSGTKPFSETALDIRLPTSPEKAYELMFKNEEFQKKFSTEQMKLIDLEIQPWSGDKLKTRSFSYIKPLGGSIGPSKTSCKIEEEELHVDPETYFEVLTVTRTPDVPSGDIFKVNTKSSLSWAGGSKGGTRVLVTTECEWDGRSMLKSTITKASIAGQRDYHKALAKELRAHIKANPGEFKTSESNEEADDELEEDDTPEPKTPTEKVVDSFVDLPNNPAASLLAILSIILLLSNIYLLIRARKLTTPVEPKDMLPRSALGRLERLEDFIRQLQDLAIRQQ